VRFSQLPLKRGKGGRGWNKEKGSTTFSSLMKIYANGFS